MKEGVRNNLILILIAYNVPDMTFVKASKQNKENHN